VSAPVEALEGSDAVERELVVRAQRGDADAFDAIVRSASDRLYGIAYRILRDADRAEDALQLALVRIWDDLPGLRDPAKFDAWSYRLVVHASYREAGQERRWTGRVRQIVADPASEDHASSVASRDELERGFRRLTPEHRAVLVLHYFVGLSLPEVAEALGIPAGTAGSRLHYAVRELRAAFEADARGAVARRITA
jgi:RNA polymerase sigma-70 factor (ECF subfamily)